MGQRKHYKSDLRENVRLWMLYVLRDLGITQAELADRTGIDQGTLSGYLSGNKNVGLDSFVKLHEAKLGISANMMIDRPPSEKELPAQERQFARDGRRRRRRTTPPPPPTADPPHRSALRHGSSR